MNSLSLENVESCLRTVAKVSLDNEKFFCDLDGEMGDADFGKTLADGFRAVLRQLDGEIDRSSIGTFLMKVGSAFAGSAGGTTGPMWGTAFLRAGINSKEKQTINLSDLVVMGRAAIAGSSSDDDSRLLGRDGSTSRISRSISANATPRSRLPVNGGEPVSSW